MGQLTNQYVSSSYQGLLKMTDSTQGLTNTLQTIQTGDGDNSPLQMSFTGVNISGSFFINNVPITNGTNGTSGTSGVAGSSGTSGSSGSNGSSGTSGQSGSSGSAGSDGSSGTSGTSGSNGSSGTSGTSGSDGLVGSNGTSGTSGSNGSDGSSGTSGLTDKTGLITTGSIVTTQQITGSLILGNTVLSGSLVGNTVNGGLIQIRTEASLSGSVGLYISSSSPVSQSNFIFGGAGPTPATLTGSIVISGSNNIMLQSNRAVTVGSYGYLTNNNIGNNYPTLGTGSLLRPTVSNNALQGVLNLQFTTSSLTAPSILNNLIYGTTNINHQSGSISFNNNIVLSAQQFLSNANTTTLNLSPLIFSNIIAGIAFPMVTLSHNSSSIVYQGNIGAGLTVTNNYSSSVSTGVDNINVRGNLLIGANNVLTVSGSNSANRRTFDYNTILGSGNRVNSDYATSSAGHLVSTGLIGQGLIVSASNTSNVVGGTVMVGRFNATGSLQESSQDTVFVVGTGTNDGNRRNALRIDNNNNSNFTGSVNISGSLNITGSLNAASITGSLQGTASFATNFDKTGLITTGSVGNTQNITSSLVISSSLNVYGKINDLKIWTGSALVNSIGIGNNTLQSQSGSDASNIAIGNGALATNVTGSGVVAIGGGALGNSVAGFNVAIGASALGANTTGRYNIGIGQSAFQANTIGEKNTAIGWNSGVNNLTGSTNTIIGAQALSNNVNGSGNIAIGNYAGYYSTGSNEFFIHNDNLGSADSERSGSLMWGNFANPISGQNLQINANTNIRGTFSVNGSPVGSTVGLITTGSIGGTQNITGSLILSSSAVTIIAQPGNPSNALFIQSGSMIISDVSGSIRIATANNQPQLFFNQDRRVGFFLGQCNMDQVNTQFGITDDSTDNYTMGGNFNNFRTGSNNLMLAINNINLKSGSFNTIFARDTSYNTGSNNLMLGRGPQGINECQDYFNLQLPNSNDPIMFKSGSANALTLNSNVLITGSLNVLGGINYSSGSNTTVGTVALNGANPGTATVSNSLVTANSLIFLTKQTNNHPNAGPVVVSSKGSSTFTITSNHNGDTDVVAYQIINPA